MDLSKHLDEIVKNIVSDIQTKVGNQVASTVRAELESQLKDYDFETTIADIATKQLDKKIAELDFGVDGVQKRINSAAGTIISNIDGQASKEISALIGNKIASVDFSKKLTDAVAVVIENRIESIAFPDGSISPSSINTTDMVLSGNNIVGGIIKGFGSTGIDDKATNCVMTIMDAAVVVENNLVTLDLTVQGNLDVKGTVPESSPFFKQLTKSVTSSVQDGLDTELFSGFSDTIFGKIKKDGLDLSRITVNEQTVIEGNQIGFGITESNLQKLGLLKELQVEGESLFAETLYVGSKRVGVNTMEPSAALAVWDEDVEITFSKFKDGTGKISTPRNQSLVLGSNRHNNIIMSTDGQTQIDNLQIGVMRFNSSETPPQYASTKGHVVFNANPSVGGPLGWVCLGSANWANFGIID
jgi:hypothetical protein